MQYIVCGAFQTAPPIAAHRTAATARHHDGDGAYTQRRIAPSIVPSSFHRPTCTSLRMASDDNSDDDDIDPKPSSSSSNVKFFELDKEPEVHHAGDIAHENIP